MIRNVGNGSVRSQNAVTLSEAKSLSDLRFFGLRPQNDRCLEEILPSDHDQGKLPPPPE